MYYSLNSLLPLTKLGLLISFKFDFNLLYIIENQ